MKQTLEEAGHKVNTTKSGIFIPGMNQVQNDISQGNKGMRSYVLYGNGDFNLRPVKCATSDDNYAGASWSNEGEFGQIMIK